MKKRNFILLIILLIIIALTMLVLLYAKKTPPGTGGGGNGGIVNFISDFNPFKKAQNTPPETPADISDYRDESVAEIDKNVLTKVSTMPIAGFGAFTKERFIDVPTVIPGGETTSTTETPTAPPTEFVTAIRYVDKGTGNIYQTYADRINERKFSDTVVLGVHEAMFGNHAGSVIMRYLRPDKQTIATFVGRLPSDTLGADISTTKLEGSFLPEGSTDVSISADTTKIFYLYNLKDTAIGMVSGALGENKTQVLDSAFTEWLSSWPAPNIITLTTKASGKVPGYLYSINPNTKDFNKIFGGILGLTTLTSPSGSLVLYGNSNLVLSVYNTETREIRSLGVNTLPEKCVWSKDGVTLYCSVPKNTTRVLYPDAWYQGEVGFSDQLWKIGVENSGSAVLLDVESEPAGEDIDGIKLALSENEDYLFLVNKKDSFLWELRLK